MERIIAPEINKTKEILKPNSFRRSNRWALPTLLLAGSVLLAACGAPVKTVETTPAEASATAFAAENPNASTVNLPSVSKATEPTPSPTPEPEKVINCTLVPEEYQKYCNSAEIIPYTDPVGNLDLVAINLPAGVPLIAPKDGQLSTAEANAPFSGSWAGFGGIVIIGNYTLSINAPAGTPIVAGTHFGTTTETDHKNLDGKTIIVQVAERDPNTRKWFTPKGEVEKYFPGIYSKPVAKAVSFEETVKPVTTYNYTGGPNDPQ